MENLKIYIAGPLYSDAEKNYNLKVSALLESLGNSTFLPQRDGLEDTLVRSYQSELGRGGVRDYPFQECLQDYWMGIFS